MSSPVIGGRKRKKDGKTEKSMSQSAKKTALEQKFSKEGDFEDNLVKRHHMAKGTDIGRHQKNRIAQLEAERSNEPALKDHDSVPNSDRNYVREADVQQEQLAARDKMSLKKQSRVNKSYPKGSKTLQVQQDQQDKGTESDENGVAQDVLCEDTFGDVEVVSQDFDSEDFDSEDSYEDSSAIQRQILKEVKRIGKTLKKLQKKGLRDDEVSVSGGKKTVSKENPPIWYKGVDLLKLDKEQKQPQKYARKLLLQLFTMEELAVGTFNKLGHSSRSELDPERVDIFDECLKRRFQEKTLEKYRLTIINSLNKKCREIAKDNTVKTEASKSKVFLPQYIGSGDSSSSDEERE